MSQDNQGSIFFWRMFLSQASPKYFCNAWDKMLTPKSMWFTSWDVRFLLFSGTLYDQSKKSLACKYRLLSTKLGAFQKYYPMHPICEETM